MQRHLLFLLFTLSLLGWQDAFGQGATCDASTAFCTSAGASYPAGVGTGTAAAGPDYGCLGSQPSPGWFFLQVANAGPIDFAISNSTAQDLDYAIWGPFPAGSNLSTICGQLSTGSIPPADCSYSGSAHPELGSINATAVGEIWILLVTNFSNTPTNVTINQTNAGAGGNGFSDCSVVNCVSTDVTAPSFSCPADVNVAAGSGGSTSLCEANVTIPIPTVTDACDVFPDLTNDFTGTDDASGAYPVGTTTVTWTAVDDAGNSMSCTQDVTVTPPVAPSITGPTLLCAAGTAALTATGSGAAGAELNWYDAATGGTLLHTGATYSPNVTTTTTLYVEESQPAASDQTWTFNTGLDGWTASSLCGSSTWTTATDGGNNVIRSGSANNLSALIASPAVNVSGLTTLNLAYDHRYQTETNYDNGYVVYRLDGGAWQQFTPTIVGYDAPDNTPNDGILGGCGSSPSHPVYRGTRGYTTDGGAINVTGASTLEIGFYFGSDGSVTNPNWFIDEVRLTGFPPAGAPLCASARTAHTVNVGGVPVTISPAAPFITSGANATLTATATAGTPNFTFTWREVATGTVVAGPTSGASNTSSITVSPATTTAYEVTVTDNTGCSGTATVNVNVTTPSTGGGGSVGTQMPADFIAAYAQDTSRIEVKWLHSWPDEQGFYLYRATEDNDYVQIAIVPTNPDTIRYMDTGLDPDTQYHYFVRAYRGAEVSTHSDQAEDITFPRPPSVVDITEACVNSYGAIEVTSEYDNYRWYDTPSRWEDALLSPTGEYYNENYFVTPNITDTAQTFYVSTVGRRYQSFPRTAITVNTVQKPNAQIVGLTPDSLYVDCNTSRWLEVVPELGIEYQWFHNGRAIHNADSSAYLATWSGEYTVYAKRFGCSSGAQSVRLKLGYTPGVEILQGTSQIAFCQNGTLEAESTMGASLEWFLNGNSVGTGSTLDVNTTGTYTVVATENGCTSSDEIEVTFRDLPTDLTLSADAQELCPGEVATFTAPTIPGATNVVYEWYRNDQQVSYTETPTFSTTAPGTYYARVINTQNCTALTSELAVTVYDVPQTRLKRIGDDLEVRLIGNGNLEAIAWYLDDVLVPGATTTTITPQAEGLYRAELTFEGGCMKSTSDYNYMFIVTGIEDDRMEEDNIQPAVYPNPTSGSVTVRLGTQQAGQVNLRVYDALGRTLLTKEFTNTQPGERLGLDLQHLSSGTYMLEVVNGTHHSLHKLVRE